MLVVAKKLYLSRKLLQDINHVFNNLSMSTCGNWLQERRMCKNNTG